MRMLLTRKSGGIMANPDGIPSNPCRHGRACPGHPRFAFLATNSWMPGTSAGHDEVGLH
jgi:hypothetical protein